MAGGSTGGTGISGPTQLQAGTPQGMGAGQGPGGLLNGSPQGQGAMGAPSLQAPPTGAGPSAAYPMQGLSGQQLARTAQLNYGFAPQPDTTTSQNWHTQNPKLYGGGWNALSQMMAGPSYQQTNPTQLATNAWAAANPQAAPQVAANSQSLGGNR